MVTLDDYILNEEEKKLIEENINEKEYWLYFMKYLNLIRSEGKFSLGKNSFETIGNLMGKIMGYINKERIFNDFGLCLILCQTYYYLKKTKKKVYLTIFIKDSELIQADDFWQYYFDNLIEREIKRFQERFDNNKKQESNETMRFSALMSKLLYPKLIELVHNMGEFQVDKEKIKELLSIITKKYEISEEELKQIYILVDSQQYESFKTIKEEIYEGDQEFEILGK